MLNEVITVSHNVFQYFVLTGIQPLYGHTVDLNISLQVHLFDFVEKETMQHFILDHIHCVSRGCAIDLQN